MQFEQALNGELEKLQDTLVALGKDVNEQDKNGRTVLHWACTGKHLSIVKYLVEKLKANVTIVDDMGWTPLMIASSVGSTEIVDILLNNGADIDSQNINGCTALHYSSSKNHIFVTKFLIVHGAKVDIKENIIGETPLHRATVKSNYAIMELLLEKGANVDSLNRNNESPLVLAIINNDMPAIELLIRYGASINDKNPDTNKSPLDYAPAPLIKKINELL